jgi:hypothetical protein
MDYVYVTTDTIIQNNLFHHYYNYVYMNRTIRLKKKASAVLQERPFWNPYCVVGRPLFWVSRSSFMTTSSTLDMADQIDTGLYNAGSARHLPPPLKTGWTIPFLNPRGTEPLARLWLMK